ncbi:MAG: protein-glutamate O-methyltransferase CheR [Desulfobacteraceae bacterium]|jgi:chemotaxis protein methyltransferase CheR
MPGTAFDRLSRPAPTAPQKSPPVNAGLKKNVKISSDEIQLLSKYIYALSGIHIEASKAYLLETRLGRLLETEQCTSYGEFYHKAKADTSKTLEKKILDAITTNETLFFRDASPFELLKHKILPEVIDRKSSAALKSPIRIWSAACSTGQEVYSIAIVLKELLGNTQLDVKLTGTDLSNAAIKQASYGSYNKFEIERGLPRERLQRYFTADGANWKVKDQIRVMASFRKFNLMHPFNALGKFDIIFCRNVAIYFTLEDRKKLFQKLASVLEPDGYLIIGSTESLTGVCPRFVPKRHLKSLFYQLR